MTKNFVKDKHQVKCEDIVKDLNQEQFSYITQFSQILANDEELEEGEFELGIFTVKVNKTHNSSYFLSIFISFL